MEIKKIFRTLALILTLASCSNTPELETGEIKLFKYSKMQLFNQENQKNLSTPEIF